jgi:hypothetical protein
MSEPPRVGVVRVEPEEFERVETPVRQSPRPPTFPPPSQDGAPPWAQHPPQHDGIESRMLSEEQSALRRLSPIRNRWPDLAKFDERTRRITERRAERTQRIGELQEQIRAAETSDKEALATWTFETSKPRPQPTVPALEAELDETRREVDASIVAENRVLAEKADFIAKNRKRLVSEANAATDAAHKRYVEAVAALEAARSELVENRQAAIWASLTPQPESAYTPATGALCAGLREPVMHTLGSEVQLAFQGIASTLRADADVLKSISTREQAEKLGTRMRDQAVWMGGTDFFGPATKAAWNGSPEAAEEDNKLKRYTRELHRKVWGIDPL